MRSLVMAVYLLTNALGSYVGAGLLSIIDSLTKNDPWFPGFSITLSLEIIYFESDLLL